MEQEFSVAAVLSVTTGVMLGDALEVRELMEFMTSGLNLEKPTESMREEVAPFIFRQYPELDGWKFSGGSFAMAVLVPSVAASLVEDAKEELGRTSFLLKPIEEML